MTRRVLLLHAGASSSAQWGPLRARLASVAEVRAPDLHGHGATPAPPDLSVDTVIPAQVADLRPLLEPPAAGLPRTVVVGHSYGAAVALFLALACPERVAALVLVEPPLFALLDPGDPADAAAAAEIDALEAANLADLARGEPLRATERFVRYWSGDALWETLPDSFRAPLVETADARHRLGIAAVRTAALPADVGARLTMPITLLVGGASPAPTRRVTARLAERLPRADLIEVTAAGHMLPASHPRAVLGAVLSALGETESG